MIAYLLRRTFQALVVVLAVTVITFLLLHLMPGGPIVALLGPRSGNTALVASLTHQLGLDQALPSQYWHWLDALLHGDLGFSYKADQTVDSLLVVATPRTVVLIGESTLVALLIAVPLGVAQAVRRNSWFDYLGTSLSFVLYATPTFFLGLLCLLLFSDDLGWFPPSAPNADGIGPYLTDWRAMFLPVMTLALPTVASFSRYVRSSVLDQLTQEYVRTATAKGVPRRRLLYRHVLRNALMPMITLLGYTLPALFGGALITEVVFNMPGLGLLYWNAAQQTDFAVMLGLTVLIAMATVLGSLLADLGYAAADPRVRLVD